MIYFDQNKQAYAFVIADPLCAIEENVWKEYSSLQQGVEYDIDETGIIDLRDTPGYEQEQAQKERQRLNLLNLTKADVLLALYQDKGLTPDNIKAMLKDNVPALIKFDYASSYYRGDDVVNALGLALGYSTEEMDYLFENKKFPEKTVEPVEPADTDSDSDTDSDNDNNTDLDTDNTEINTGSIQNNIEGATNENTTDTSTDDVSDEVEQPADTTEAADTNSSE